MGRVNHRVAQAATANKTQVDQVQMTAIKGRSRIDCMTTLELKGAGTQDQGSG
jgi:hypothetical protein